MAKTFRRTGLLRAVNPLMLGLLRLGLGPSRTWALTVRGRRSGREYTTPVNLVERDGRRYLVSPYGSEGWAKNAGADGRAKLARGGKSEEVRLRELTPEESAPVLRQYLGENPITRPYFDVTISSSDTAIAAEAPRHPVFLIDRAA